MLLPASFKATTRKSTSSSTWKHKKTILHVSQRILQNPARNMQKSWKHKQRFCMFLKAFYKIIQDPCKNYGSTNKDSACFSKHFTKSFKIHAKITEAQTKILHLSQSILQNPSRSMQKSWKHKPRFCIFLKAFYKILQDPCKNHGSTNKDSACFSKHFTKCFKIHAKIMERETKLLHVSHRILQNASRSMQKSWKEKQSFYKFLKEFCKILQDPCKNHAKLRH